MRRSYLSGSGTRNSPRLRLSLVLLLFSCMLVSALHQAGISRAQSSDLPFSAEPAPGSPSFETGYFLINASPGETVTEMMMLKNESDAPIKLSVMTVDATTGPYGGISYGLPTEPVTRTGNWTALPFKEVSLAPNETKTIPLSVTVPAGATSGDHVGGVAVWLPIEAEQGEAPQSAITTHLRRVLSVHVVVPGTADPLLVINGVRPVVRPDGVYLEIDISSDGDLLTRGEGYIDLPNDDFRHEFALDTFVPDTKIAYPIKWINDPEEKTYETRVVIDYSGHRAEYSGSFTIGEDLTAQEKAREGEKSHTLIYVALALLPAGFLIYFIRR